MLHDYQLEEYLDAATSENREWLASEGTVLSTTRNVSSMQQHDGIGNDSRVMLQYQLEESLLNAATS